MVKNSHSPQDTAKVAVTAFSIRGVHGEGWGEGNSLSRSFHQSAVQSLVLILLLVLDQFFKYAPSTFHPG
jgi:hypothetical protein